MRRTAIYTLLITLVVSSCGPIEPTELEPKTDKMKTTIEVVGMIFTLPFLALEAMIKGVMYILYFPLILCIAIIYPFIKRADLSWTGKWWKYANTWKKGFYSGYIYRLWEVED